jgi:hypothetical protein
MWGGVEEALPRNSTTAGSSTSAEPRIETALGLAPVKREKRLGEGRGDEGMRGKGREKGLRRGLRRPCPSTTQPQDGRRPAERRKDTARCRRRDGRGGDGRGERV